MSMESQKLELIGRLMKIDSESILDRINELWDEYEMQARVEVANEAIERGDVISLEQFGKDSEERLKKKRSN